MYNNNFNIFIIILIKEYKIINIKFKKAFIKITKRNNIYI